MGLTKTPEEFAWMNRREVGMELAQGVQLAHFDIHGGYYEDQRIMQEVRDLVRVREQSLRLKHRASHAQILVVMDEESEHYLTFRNPLLSPLLSGQLTLMGFVAPYETLLLSDLPNADTSACKLAIILNAVKLDTAQRKIIQRKLACDNRTILWFHAPGYTDGQTFDRRYMKALTGIQIEPNDAVNQAGAIRFADSKLELDKPCSTLPGQQFVVTDASALPLAWRQDQSTNVVVAVRKLSGWTSVYSAAAPLPASFLRQLAMEARVHIYTSDPAFLHFANEHFLMLAAPDRSGSCEITLPRPRTVLDAITNRQLARDTNKLSVTFRPKEVRLLYMP